MNQRVSVRLSSTDCSTAVRSFNREALIDSIISRLAARGVVVKPSDIQIQISCSTLSSASGRRLQTDDVSIDMSVVMLVGDATLAQSVCVTSRRMIDGSAV